MNLKMYEKGTFLYHRGTGERVKIIQIYGFRGKIDENISFVLQKDNGKEIEYVIRGINKLFRKTKPTSESMQKWNLKNIN